MKKVSIETMATWVGIVLGKASKEHGVEIKLTNGTWDAQRGALTVEVKFEGTARPGGIMSTHLNEPTFEQVEEVVDPWLVTMLNVKNERVYLEARW